MNRALICQLRRLLRSHVGNVRWSYWICVFTSPLCSATCTRACFVRKCLLFLQRTSWVSPWPPEVHEGRGISDGTVSQLHMKRIGFKRFQDSEYRPSRGKISSLNPWLFRVYSVHCLKDHAAVNGWGTLHTCSWLRSASIFSAFTQWSYALPEVLEVPFSGRFCFESGLWSSLYKISFRCNIHSSMILLMKRRYISQDDTSPRAFSFESSSLQHSIYSKPLPRSAPLARWGTMFPPREKKCPTVSQQSPKPEIWEQHLLGFGCLRICVPLLPTFTTCVLAETGWSLIDLTSFIAYYYAFQYPLRRTSLILQLPSLPFCQDSPKENCQRTARLLRLAQVGLDSFVALVRFQGNRHFISPLYAYRLPLAASILSFIAAEVEILRPIRLKCLAYAFNIMQ